MDFLHRFNEHLGTYDRGAAFSQRMYLIDLLLFSEAQKIGDVDFSTFTVTDLKNAMDDICSYESDEMADPHYGDGANFDNPIYEINLLAGLKKEVVALKPERKKIRRFF